MKMVCAQNYEDRRHKASNIISAREIAEMESVLRPATDTSPPKDLSAADSIV